MPSFCQDRLGTNIGKPLIPKTALSLDIVMIENYSPSPDAHAKSDHGVLRSGVPWTPMVNCVRGQLR